MATSTIKPEKHWYKAGVLTSASDRVTLPDNNIDSFAFRSANTNNGTTWASYVYPWNDISAVYVIDGTIIDRNVLTFSTQGLASGRHVYIYYCK